MNSFYKGALAVCFTLLAGNCVFAQEAKMNSFELLPQISYVTYKESGVKETGPFYGLTGAYTYRGDIADFPRKTMLKAEGRLSFGRVKYDGHLTDGTPYTISGINDALFEIRGLGGMDFVISTTTVTPFAGLGYRFLSDNLSKDPAGYRRFSNYFYSPIGVETKTPFGNGWAGGVKFEYDVFWYGRQYSYLSDYNSAFNDVANDQDKGYGLRGSIRLSKENERFNFIVEPYVAYWNIDESNKSSVTLYGTAVGTAWEPKNTSTEYGAKIGMEF